jgi:hypothetical protein
LLDFAAAAISWSRKLHEQDIFGAGVLPFSPTELSTLKKSGSSGTTGRVRR